MSKIFNKNKRGFTLIEALVAISILMVAVASPMVIAQKGLSSAVFSKDQMIAYYLAQDAMELIKNLRDANGLGGREWLDGLSELCVTVGNEHKDTLKCTVDVFNPSNPVAAYQSNQGYLYENEDNQYTHLEVLGGDDPKFKRAVTIVMVDNGGNLDIEAMVYVRVWWGSNPYATESSVLIKSLIYDFW